MVVGTRGAYLPRIPVTTEAPDCILEEQGLDRRSSEWLGL